MLEVEDSQSELVDVMQAKWRYFEPRCGHLDRLVVVLEEKMGLIGLLGLAYGSWALLQLEIWVELRIELRFEVEAEAVCGFCDSFSALHDRRARQMEQMGMCMVEMDPEVEPHCEELAKLPVSAAVERPQ